MLKGFKTYTDYKNGAVNTVNDKQLPTELNKVFLDLNPSDLGQYNCKEHFIIGKHEVRTVLKKTNVCTDTRPGGIPRIVFK